MAFAFVVLLLSFGTASGQFWLLPQETEQPSLPSLFLQAVTGNGLGGDCPDWKDWEVSPCVWMNDKKGLPESCTVTPELPKFKIFPQWMYQIMEAKEPVDVLKEELERRGNPEMCGHCARKVRCRVRQHANFIPSDKCPFKQVEILPEGCPGTKACKLTTVNGECPAPRIPKAASKRQPIKPSPVLPAARPVPVPVAVPVPVRMLPRLPSNLRRAAPQSFMPPPPPMMMQRPPMLPPHIMMALAAQRAQRPGYMRPIGPWRHNCPYYLRGQPMMPPRPPMLMHQGRMMPLPQQIPMSFPQRQMMPPHMMMMQRRPQMMMPPRIPQQMMMPQAMRYPYPTVSQMQQTIQPPQQILYGRRSQPPPPPNPQRFQQVIDYDMATQIETHYPAADGRDAKVEYQLILPSSLRGAMMNGQQERVMMQGLTPTPPGRPTKQFAKQYLFHPQQQILATQPGSEDVKEQVRTLLAAMGAIRRRVKRSATIEMHPEGNTLKSVAPPGFHMRPWSLQPVARKQAPSRINYTKTIPRPPAPLRQMLKKPSAPVAAFNSTRGPWNEWNCIKSKSGDQCLCCCGYMIPDAETGECNNMMDLLPGPFGKLPRTQEEERAMELEQEKYWSTLSGTEADIITRMQNAEKTINNLVDEIGAVSDLDYEPEESGEIYDLDAFYGEGSESSEKSDSGSGSSEEYLTDSSDENPIDAMFPSLTKILRL